MSGLLHSCEGALESIVRVVSRCVFRSDNLPAYFWKAGSGRNSVRAIGQSHTNQLHWERLTELGHFVRMTVWIAMTMGKRVENEIGEV